MDKLDKRFGVSVPFEDPEIEDFRIVPRFAERIAWTPPAVL